MPSREETNAACARWRVTFDAAAGKELFRNLRAMAKTTEKSKVSVESLWGTTAVIVWSHAVKYDAVAHWIIRHLEVPKHQFAHRPDASEVAAAADAGAQAGSAAADTGEQEASAAAASAAPCDAALPAAATTAPDVPVASLPMKLMQHIHARRTGQVQQECRNESRGSNVHLCILYSPYC